MRLYEGAPTASLLAIDGVQDDRLTHAAARAFLATTPLQRDVAGTVNWYREHETTQAIGWDPDGMCQKVCRTARNIGSYYPSAIAQQAATPESKRVRSVAEVKRGMVAFYDDPRDSNPFGHIVTVVGRDQTQDPSRLSSLLVRTNSVVAGQLVVVRGDYFPAHWGDAFQFAGTTLNGVDLIFPEAKPDPEPDPIAPHLKAWGLERLERIRATLSSMIEHQSDPRIKAALVRDRRRITETIRKYRP